ncbi:aspartate aminotransferase family protein [Paenibacillus sp. FSL H8-0548]|uniref:aspartate aminotransferase family protein n=1 Tax=Paenibacillus sp. FSL H8-0548 TaxID=1920422 RepID=UPI00096CA8B9|nr:aspartate aminotransferase family protein [Paenibacillus sp. FSL H8-0548]OMF34647.1 aspartate aminotransferase family protein [Paenibacillus sp. FSL H8-0548]
MSYANSQSKLEQSKKYLAGGVASTLRAAMKPTPLFAASGKGARIRDIDNNEFIDYLLAYGPLILGHAHPSLTSALTEASLTSVAYGLQHEGEIELARLLCEILPCADKVALSGSGTEAVMLALRLARAHTGRRKVVRFHGHYHGWSDAIFTSFPSADMKQSANSPESEAQILPGTGGQSERSLEDVILLPWNDFEALEKLLREEHGQIAAVISEPVMCNSGCIKPKENYLAFMRALTDELGIVMILDEVITGFRLGLGGAHGKYGLKPDLVTVGKALGGGIAISAVAGNAEIMKHIELGTVSHLGTLNGNAAATAAAISTLRELASNGGSAYIQMNEVTNELVAGIRKLLIKHQIPGILNREGPVFHMMFTEQSIVEDFQAFNQRDAALYSQFAELMLNEGVLVRTNGLWYVSAVHGQQEIKDTLHAVDHALKQLKIK